MSGSVRVSVVTPFYNTAAYLAECIESVLAQTHDDFEYILTDNKSTDGSLEIAQRYAARDARVRVVQNANFVSQVENYNGVLALIGAQSKYVKVASADDILYPECLAKLIEVGEQHPSAGLIASYYVTEDGPGANGVPFAVTCLSGREICRRMLLNGAFPLGTPTSVMYRADLVRARPEFYPRTGYHFDTEVAYELLLEHDFGFAHQILSYLRSDDASITSRRQSFHPNLLDLYVVLLRHGPKVLETAEYDRRFAEVHGQYMAYLGRAALRGKGKDFWAYHRKGLASVGHTLDWRDVLPYAMLEAGRMALSPGVTIERVLTDLRSRAGF